MTDLVIVTGNNGSTGIFRRLAGLQRVLATGWRRQPGRSVAAEAARDSGARREVQDYASAAPLEVAASRRLHRIAEAAQWSLPRL